MACESLEGAGTFSEEWVVGLYQYICVLLSKGRCLRCTRCYEGQNASGGSDDPLSAPIHPSAWKRNSPKFTVTSGRRYGFQGCPSLCTLAPPARFKAQLIAFVARNCYKPLRLATAQLT